VEAERFPLIGRGVFVCLDEQEVLEMAVELSTRYEPHATEADIYKRWLETGCFNAEPDLGSGRPPYCITIPPPNVTGALHIGHALNNTIMDTLGRWKRMLGYNVLILPGTDHAGIATQSVVEKRIATEGLTRQDLGREKFVERVWEWKQEYGDRIVGQMQRLGCSYDWRRLRFTMDQPYVDAIMDVFGKWHADGYIYLGERMVNWSPKLMTAISDIEVEDKELDGHLWHLRYPLADGTGDVIVATTRPETMLGDTAVAVHPEDPRYTAVVGKLIDVPLLGRQIPIVADDFVKLEFGTGAVKVTPFHDANDFECGLRNNLPRMEVIGPDARMTEAAGVYAGLDRFEARKRVVADLDAAGFLVKVEAYRHKVPHCDRSGAVIEPRPSHQWFCKMSGTPMVDKAIDAATSGRINFVPERYSETYVRWLENIRDWPISRGLWWGHRLPVWRIADSDPTVAGNWVFARTSDVASEKLGSTDIVQSDDVLDTWFSSALWPFATLGWPEKTDSLKQWYPTSLLSTAQEIMYLWVARMVMTGEYFLGEKPFDTVYIHATILDEHGSRMSKSKGNGVDPVDLIDLYGADALRFALMREAGLRQDIRVKPIRDNKQDQVEQARNFCNKIWNASRFVLMNLDGYEPPAELPTSDDLVDRWILARLDQTAEAVATGFDTYRMDDASRAIQEFFWDDFCDWYIEAAKPRLSATDGSEATAKAVLWHVLDRSLKLMHPVLPFLTEAIWQQLPFARERAGVEHLMQSTYPAAGSTPRDEAAVGRWDTVREVIRATRNIQAENQLKKGGDIYLNAATDEIKASVAASESLVRYLTKCDAVHFEVGPEDGFLAVTAVGEVRLPRPSATPEVIEAERKRLSGELAKIDKDLAGLAGRLSDPTFAEKAPEAVVAKARGQQAELLERRGKVAERLEQLD